MPRKKIPTPIKPKRVLKKQIAPKKGAVKTARRATSQKRGKLSPGRTGADVKKVLGKPPVAVCAHCGAVYYDEHWHKSRQAKNTSLETKRLRLASCEACDTEAKNIGTATAGFAGEVTLEGFASAADKQELLALARNVGKQAMALDSTHRISRIIDEGAIARIYTTENQLAASIGKRVDDARKGGKLEIVWSEHDKPVRVSWRGKE